jgi:hypothetical protein
MATKYRQDMPPEGGYREFNWERTFPKRILKRKFNLGVVLNEFMCLIENCAYNSSI